MDCCQGCPQAQQRPWCSLPSKLPRVCYVARSGARGRNDLRADMVIRKFWLISLSHNYKLTIAIYCTNRCCLICKPTTGVRRDTRTTRQRLSKPNVAAYFKTSGTRHEVRDYYATRRIRLDKAKCRDAKMEKEHYMKVITYY